MYLIEAGDVEKVLKDVYEKRPLDSDRWLIDDIKRRINELPKVTAVPVSVLESYKKSCETIRDMKEFGTDIYLHWHCKVKTVEEIIAWEERKEE